LWQPFFAAQALFPVSKIFSDCAAREGLYLFLPIFRTYGAFEKKQRFKNQEIHQLNSFIL